MLLRASPSYVVHEPCNARSQQTLMLTPAACRNKKKGENIPFFIIQFFSVSMRIQLEKQAIAAYGWVDRYIHTYYTYIYDCPTVSNM